MFTAEGAEDAENPGWIRAPRAAGDQPPASGPDAIRAGAGW